MILAGTDELGYLLSKDAEIDGLGGGPSAPHRGTLGGPALTVVVG